MTTNHVRAKPLCQPGLIGLPSRNRIRLLKTPYPMAANPNPDIKIALNTRIQVLWTTDKAERYRPSDGRGPLQRRSYPIEDLF